MGPSDVPPADPPTVVAPAPVELRWGEVSVQGLAGGRAISVGAFDAPLRSSGYAALPRDYAGGGFSLDLSIARWRVAMTLMYTQASAPSLVDSSQVGASVGDVGLYFGYDVIRWGGLTGFVLGGLGYDALMMDAHAPHWSWIATQTGVGGDVSTVEQDIFTFGLQGGLQEIIPFGRLGSTGMFGLLLSLRGGYLQQIGNVGWMTTGASQGIGGMPAVDLSGAWISFGAGFVVYGSPAPSGHRVLGMNSP